MVQLPICSENPKTGKIVPSVDGSLKFNLTDPTFDYVLNGHGLRPETQCSLIYYADPWPTSHAGTFILSAVTDAHDHIYLAGSFNLGFPTYWITYTDTDVPQSFRSESAMLTIRPSVA